MLQVVEPGLIEMQAVFMIDPGQGEIVERPHAFVCVGGHGGQEQGTDPGEGGYQSAQGGCPNYGFGVTVTIFGGCASAAGSRVERAYVLNTCRTAAG